MQCPPFARPSIMSEEHNRLYSQVIGTLPEGITSRDAAHLWMLDFHERWVCIDPFFLFGNVY
jgi:hypothetical protein